MISTSSQFLEHSPLKNLSSNNDYIVKRWSGFFFKAFFMKYFAFTDISFGNEN